VPTRDAEKAVIRVLRPDSVKRLETVGFLEHDMERVRGMLGHPDGIVVVTGPTGSGKTTTVYATLLEVATSEVNVVTVEDPVEYDLPSITQIQVDTRRGVTFARSLRAILRQDPDVIFVGEIRDEETAEIAAQAAMTGHLVLATLHTNDAIGVLSRMKDLGLDRSTIGATLRGVVSQRLVRRLCPDCAEPTDGVVAMGDSRLVTRYGIVPPMRAKGCEACRQTGYRGRLPINETMIVDEATEDMITHGAPVTDIEALARAAGMQSLLQSAMLRVEAGETTLREVQRVLGEPPQPPRGEAGEAEAEATPAKAAAVGK
jgi:type II secretory ATPase GspE/PulE/Tfp pilus assembly ATPase PilB-like protein